MKGCLFTTTLLLLLGGAGTPWAGPGDSKAKAQKLFKEGKQAYESGHFDEATTKFKACFSLDPQPAFLLNIAQTYRKAQNPRQAIEYYEQFLKVAPDSPLRSQVEEIITELRASPPPTTPAAQPPAARPDLSPRPLTQPARDAPPSTSGAPTTPIYKKWWFWTAIVAVVGASAGIAAYAATREPDYVKEGALGSVRW